MLVTHLIPAAALLVTFSNSNIPDPGAEYLATIIQPLVTDMLTDPDSAKFYWPYKFSALAID